MLSYPIQIDITKVSMRAIIDDNGNTTKETLKAMANYHSEPYTVLAGLTHDSALISWGSFYFKIESERLDGRFKLIEDKDLRHLNPPVSATIGERSGFYGPAKVQIFKAGSTIP